MATLRVHISLNVLDSEFNQVRGKILRKVSKLIWRAHMHMLGENTSKDKPLGAIVQSLRI